MFLALSPFVLNQKYLHVASALNTRPWPRDSGLDLSLGLKSFDLI